MGHIYQAAEVAKGLIQRGHRVTVVLKNPEGFKALMGNADVLALQAPCPALSKIENPPLNHADILFQNGYGDVLMLSSLLSAWKRVLVSLAPDYLITEAAPTAALVAKRLNFRLLNLDSGFFSPPIADPLPSLRSWEAADATLLRSKEAIVLGVTNAAMHIVGLSKLACFSELFEHDTYWINWWETNHFNHPDHEKHLGPILPEMTSSKVCIRQRGKFIVGYLKPSFTLTVPTLLWLRSLEYKIMVFLPGASDKLILSLRAREIDASSTPLNLSALLPTATFFLGHGGIASTTLSVSLGTPPVLLPTQVEQYRLYLRLREHNLTPKLSLHAHKYFVDLSSLSAVQSTVRAFSRHRSTYKTAVSRILEILEA